ncbi:hypothetical protein DV735_g1467, partial [Chaetothyriales sp. CBS 134920]
MAAVGVPGTIYVYEPKRTLPLFVYNSARGGTNDDNSNTTTSNDNDSSPQNILLFVGGMWDALATTPYVATLADYLSSSSNGSKWTVVHPLLSSSARQFGISSLDEDVAEISTAIDFVRSTPSLGTSSASRVVLMGHSTGCQDGAIIQAPVSDRESMLHAIATRAACRAAADECNRIAATTPPDAHATTLLPYHLTRLFVSSVPMLISRWLSLMSPSSPEQPGDDDKFSSDLGADVLAHTFGHVVASSPRGVAGRAEIHPASGIVGSAKHNLAGEAFAERWARLVDLPERVLTYLDEVVGGRQTNDAGRGVGQEAWARWRRQKEALEQEREQNKVGKYQTDD